MTGLEVAALMAVATASSGGVYGGFLALQRWLVRSLSEAAEGEVELASKAEGLGLLGRPSPRLRGKGALVLGPHALFFQTALGARRLRIDRARIVAVRTDARRHGTLSYGGQPVLQVRYTDEHGEEQHIGFVVPDIYAWAAALTA